MLRLGLIVTTALFLLAGCEEATVKPGADATPPNEKLKAHSAEFTKQVIKVADNVHVAVGYGLANSIMIEGDDGVIIVDAMESIITAKEVKAEFAKITQKPVKAIVYTHNHSDHILGAGVFADDNPDIYAFETTSAHIDKIMQVIRPIIVKRAMRQFGRELPADDMLNAGIGPFLGVGTLAEQDLRRPTKTFGTDRQNYSIAGINFELFFAPGETPDQIFMWLPDQKILLPGDNYYKAFPNLYAIRGTSYRDVMDWVRSLDKMRALQPEILVPSHSRPLSGKDVIDETLTNYRDAIQYVHDQTIRLINEGLTQQQIVERIKLPAHLADKPYLQEFYGRVDWSVRSIFTGYLGWFSGNATDLHPMAEKDEADRMAKLAGGIDNLITQMNTASKAGDHQWALNLADHVLVLNSENTNANAARIAALRHLGNEEISANGRNYYLTQAMEQAGYEIPKADSSLTPIRTLNEFPIEKYMQAMPVALVAEDALDKDMKVGFRFTDTGDTFTIHVRRGVAELSRGFPADAVATVTTQSIVWKQILAKQRNPAVAFASGDVTVDGSVLDLIGFLGLFKGQ
jgi:alkyl sulfatase BDS1-like metallo-beta-lactamase superfamily hydrolase